MFNDHLLHGSAARTNSGDRKMIVFRYLPQEQSTNRFGYEPSEALMQRLTPVRQQVRAHRSLVTCCTTWDRVDRKLMSSNRCGFFDLVCRC